MRSTAQPRPSHPNHSHKASRPDKREFWEEGRSRNQRLLKPKESRILANTFAYSSIPKNSSEIYFPKLRQLFRSIFTIQSSPISPHGTHLPQLSDTRFHNPGDSQLCPNTHPESNLSSTWSQRNPMEHIVRYQPLHTTR